jgi:hypothetical protein
MEMSSQFEPSLAQIGDGRLGNDGLEECGGKLEQQSPSARTRQAAIAERGESSNASTSGSSNKIIRRCANR